MASAKERITELASDKTRTSRARELDECPTWSSDTWAPLSSIETSTNAVPLVPLPSNAATVADAGNGGAGGPAISAGSGRDGAFVTGGFCSVNGRAWCDGRCGFHKCGCAVDRPCWPPLAVVSVLVSCILSHLIQSKNSFQLAGSAFFSVTASGSCFFGGFDSDVGANWVSEPAEIRWSAGRVACLLHFLCPFCIAARRDRVQKPIAWL